MPTNYDIIIVGGGAAGFFTAINCAIKNSGLKIAILERGKEVLTKVKISGGGRCNVTNVCSNPNELIKFYPRGEKELRSAFYQFSTNNTVEWFKNQNVTLKTEPDGRMFPVTDSSQTIIDCFLNLATKYKIDILTTQSVQNITQIENSWKVQTNSTTFLTKKIIIATGSSTKIWQLLSQLGHTIVEPVPSLFTFTIKDIAIKELMGISAAVSLKIKDTKLTSSGNLLLTHWGFSGPAILKLSAFGARELFYKNYLFTLQINWLNEITFDEVLNTLKELKTIHAKKTVALKSPFDLSNRLWQYLVFTSQILTETKWADLTKKQLHNLAENLTKNEFVITGKSTFKDEFVTAGGINLKEINFKTMESKRLKNLYFAGEVLNVDAVTGGFNFQNAWTGGYIAANAITNSFDF